MGDARSAERKGRARRPALYDLLAQVPKADYHSPLESQPPLPDGAHVFGLT
jgi:hypothetical protein